MNTHNKITDNYREITAKLTKMNLSSVEAAL